APRIVVRGQAAVHGQGQGLSGEGRDTGAMRCHAERERGTGVDGRRATQPTPVPRYARDDITMNEELIPAIIQDARTGEVLMLAYMNDESLRLTRETGETWFWSRSRNELWHKGATSGNTQRVVNIAEDCDKDALVVSVIPT